MLPKCSLQPESLAAATQGESIEFQTEELTFNVVRDDSSNHNWKLIGGDLSSEAAAEAKIQTALNISVTPPVVS